MSAAKVYIVDDDEAVRESLEALLISHGYATATFASGRAFLDASDPGAEGCLLTDVRMPDMDGLELQERTAESRPNLAVIVITGHGDVPLAVRAMKAGAVDFVEKPFTEDIIVQAVAKALQFAADRRSRHADRGEIAGRLEQLTAREREVLQGLVAGLPNKTIAYDLGISPRTVEIHRARVMEKMQARSLSELVRLSLAAGIGA
ncbi:transcriptional regulatory protein FixJ [Aliidongia dinghuensis]|uniref:Transcriptional regulatory protein FixJ n=1 Tax=Aliidongia dinghuensis TaxID=1867774 RepID=A0A8J2YZX1_9PROT|nr:response regulator FixJ [Aliidongia dinghuensis]GGF43617.1 transcriptional regulatory protein FixJ [Aliidongia dinghuensis]